MSDTVEDHQLFYEAVELESSQLEGFLDRSCTDEQQKQRLVALLESHSRNEEEGFILDHPVAELGVSDDLMDVAVSLSEGNTVGRYRLLERIGEGGMGVVFMAEQIKGVRRRVALKIIKLGMDTRQVIARFEAERQAMALFDHPNIARVLDIGSTDAGRPYFVMELVQGTGLKKFVRSSRLPLRERLELFIGICRAVQHAHQKGIIHRDLKPSNVLVTNLDGHPVAKVIDFGIAKAIGQRLTEKTLFTRYSAMVGTPQYMSPEQAEMSGVDIDTRSDIYSLGVILYELVTGSTPIPAERLKSLNPLALIETLRDCEIETPSLRVIRSKPQYSADTPKPVDRELDAVILKALSRDRNQRYANASELAADVRRYLDDEPVLAAPPSRSRKLQAFFRKHRSVVITTFTVASILAVSSVACLLMAVRMAKTNRDLNETNQKLTENVAQLQVAETKLQQAKNERLYQTAFSVALAEFSMNFFPKMDQLIDELFGKYGTVLDQEPKFGEEAVVVSDPIATFNLCLTFDENRLLDLKHADIVSSGIERMRTFLDSRDCFPFGQDARQIGQGLDHSRECRRLQKAISHRLDRSRHDFYRLLLKQYRQAFGERDSKVAEALNLLAVSLIEADEFEEAEARIREAKLIAEEEEVAVANKLLDLITPR